MRLASPNPCCGPMVSSVRNTIRSSVPWRMPGSLVDIQEEYGSVPFGCQEEFPDCDRLWVVNLRGGWLPPLSRANAGGTLWVRPIGNRPQVNNLPYIDRKSTRLKSSHRCIS